MSKQSIVVKEIKKAELLEWNAKAADMMSGVRTTIVLGRNENNYFFRDCIMGLRLRPAWWCPTACVDGTNLYYNPMMIAKLGRNEAIGVAIHECMHVILRHIIMMASGCYDQETLNIAMDLAINYPIANAGYSLPSWVCMPGRDKFADFPVGLSTMEYYDLLQKRKTDGGKKDKNGGGGEGGGDGKSQGNFELVVYKLPDGEELSEEEGGGGSVVIDGSQTDTGGCGSVAVPGKGTPQDIEAADQKCSSAAQRAAEAVKNRGNVSADLARHINSGLTPRTNWRNVLLDFATQRARIRYDWLRPNKRFLSSDVYLPSRSGKKVGELAIAIDLSGSITDEIGGLFMKCCMGIACVPEIGKVYFICHDAVVTTVLEWELGEGPPQIKFRGGGGTSHVPVFDWVAKNMDEPVGMICLTDLETCFPEKAPEYPVLWCCHNTYRIPEAPFGQTVRLDV